MGTPEANVPLGRWIVREHEALEERIRGVEAELARFNTGAATDTRDLLRILTSFDKHLRRHFAFEEEGGPLDEVGRDRAAAPQVAEVSLQHVDLEVSLARLLNALGSSTPPPKPRVVHEVRAFLRALREHEDDERALFDALG